MMKQTHNHAPVGFTVLFASLIAALLLAVGLAIFDIIFKEVSFATIVRDSNYAIYAADTGAECAQYWDRQCQTAGICSSATGQGQGPTLFATSTASPSYYLGGTFSQAAVCDGENIISGKIAANGKSDAYGAWHVIAAANGATTTFAIDLVPDTGQHPPPYCASVEVIKNVNPSNSRTSTAIISRGYNTCDSSNPNRIERAYLVSY